MSALISVLAIMGAIGVIFGFVLAFANKKLAVELNPLIHLVEDVLPKGQCGSCGYAGCQAYAEAVVLDKDVSPSLCTPGKQAVALRVAELTGKTPEEVEPRFAYVKCASPSTTSSNKFIYSGIEDCVAAKLLHNGAKECKYGCLGLGTCVKQCVFDAIELNDQGLPVVDKTNCTGCGKCASACPNNVIEMVPAGAHVVVACNSRHKGAVARKICSIACIGCSLCKKQCPNGAIEMVENLAVVDSHICIEKCSQMVCLEKCPTKAIQEILNNSLEKAASM